ncbi:hypothetical protein CJ030_MR2G000489 [Morella rubra]|uniref:Putative plant transposon protein domain-containing protein n=1 Tax=Morella rubra TaxID=262757 RepID=A0A6A1WEX9_9ROSI|nr:hypothetical protein CJ030_MR2G000489 [Morella rubra]
MARGKRARHSLADADQPVTVEERRQLILGRSVQMEREARPLELQGLNFEGRTIHDVIHSRGWDPITVQSGTISLPVVRAFYVGLMEQLTHWVDSYDVTVWDVTVTFSAQRIAEFLGLPRPEGLAIPELEDLAPLQPFDLFRLCTESGENVPGAPHIVHKTLNDFFRMLHLIMAYNIDPRKRTTESTFERARLMVRLVRGVPMDLPGYMFKLAREARLSGQGLSSLRAPHYENVRSSSNCFSNIAGCPTYPGDDRQKLRGVIDANTLAWSRAAIRQGLGPIPATLPDFGVEPPAWATSFLESQAQIGGRLEALLPILTGLQERLNKQQEQLDAIRATQEAQQAQLDAIYTTQTAQTEQLTAMALVVDSAREASLSVLGKLAESDD